MATPIVFYVEYVTRLFLLSFLFFSTKQVQTIETQRGFSLWNTTIQIFDRYFNDLMNDFLPTFCIFQQQTHRGRSLRICF